MPSNSAVKAYVKLCCHLVVKFKITSDVQESPSNNQKTYHSLLIEILNMFIVYVGCLLSDGTFREDFQSLLPEGRRGQPKSHTRGSCYSLCRLVVMEPALVCVSFLSHRRYDQ